MIGQLGETYMSTSQDFSWLQKGQLNMVSSGSMFFLRGGGFLLDLRRPMVSYSTELHTKVCS